MDKPSCGLSIQKLAPLFSICRVADYSGVDRDQPFCFTGCTDTEKSLVCPTEACPANALKREDGWRCFRLPGPLDFSLVGVLAKITGCLRDAGIPVFAVSTYDTDYVLVRSADAERAGAALSALS